MARTRLAQARFEIHEWRDKRYQFLRRFYGDEDGVKAEVARLNKGYSGPRYIYREVSR